MEVKFLKPHNGKSPGDKDTLAEVLGNYLVRMGVVVEVKHKAKETEEEKPKRGRKPKED